MRYNIKLKSFGRFKEDLKEYYDNIQNELFNVGNMPTMSRPIPVQDGYVIRIKNSKIKAEIEVADMDDVIKLINGLSGDDVIKLSATKQEK